MRVSAEPATRRAAVTRPPHIPSIITLSSGGVAPKRRRTRSKTSGNARVCTRVLVEGASVDAPCGVQVRTRWQ
jgi:hypothetical protein